jgi:hypothetical protein
MVCLWLVVVHGAGCIAATVLQSDGLQCFSFLWHKTDFVLQRFFPTATKFAGNMNVIESDVVFPVFPISIHFCISMEMKITRTQG